MNRIFKSAVSVVVMTLVLVAMLSPFASVKAAGNSDPLNSLVFSPCMGYNRVWDANYPCAGDLVIPDYVGGLPVQQIWQGALNYTDITSVVIPNTVTSLSFGYNFDGCRKLKSAVLSHGIEIIPNNAFSNCDVLEKVELGIWTTEIQARAFMNCPKLEYIELPKSIKKIQSDAFYNGAFYLDGDGLRCAFYSGSIDEWNKVSVEDKTVRDHILYVTRITSVKNSFDGIKVTAQKRPGAATYTFSRQEKKNGKWGKWVTVKTSKSPVITDTKAVKGHTYRYSVKASNGPYSTVYSANSKAVTCTKVTSIKLAKTEYAYDGKVKTPGVVVKNSAGKVLKKGTDYTLTYTAGRKSVGTYKVVVNLKGNYSGQKTLTFKIKPSKIAVSKLSPGVKSLTVAWVPKTLQTTGYQIQYSTKKDFSDSKKVTISNNKKKTHTVKNLKSGKTYYVRMRKYKVVNKVKVFSAWSAVKSIKTK